MALLLIRREDITYKERRRDVCSLYWSYLIIVKLLHILICYNYREHLNTLVLKVVAPEYILAPSFGRMHLQAVEEISALLFNQFFCIDNCCFHNDLEKLKV